MSLIATDIQENAAYTPRKMRISVEKYQQMGKAGIFQEEPRVELINGEIFTMSPITPNHAAHTNKVAAFFDKKLEGKVLVTRQNPVRLNDFSEPEPDVAVLKPANDFYCTAHPTSKDIFLLIEIAVFTLKHDQTIKKKHYAESNIPEYWIVVPSKKRIEIYKKPKNGDYIEKEVYQKDDTWTFEAFDLEVKGSDFLIEQ